MRQFLCLLFLVVHLITRGYGGGLPKFFKKVENVFKGLVGQKVGQNAGTEALKLLQNMKIQTLSDIHFHSPDLVKAFQSLSYSLQNMKIGADKSTLNVISSLQTSIDQIVMEMQIHFKDFNAALSTLGIHHGATSSQILSKGVLDAIDKLDEKLVATISKLDPIISGISDAWVGGLAGVGSESMHRLYDIVRLVVGTCDKWLSLLVGSITFTIFIYAVGNYLLGGNKITSILLLLLSIAIGILFIQLTYISSELHIAKNNNIDPEIPLVSTPAVPFCNSETISVDYKNQIDQLRSDLEKVVETANAFKNELEYLKKEVTTVETNMTKADTYLRTLLYHIVYPRPILSTLNDLAFTASSSHPPDNRFGPECSRIHNTKHIVDGIWHRGPETNDVQWLQVDLGKEYLITEIQIKGRINPNQFIKKYKITYLHPTLNVETTLSSLSGETVFDGLYHGIDIAINRYFQPFISRSVTIHPIEYEGNICLKWEIIGVPADIPKEEDESDNKYNQRLS